MSGKIFIASKVIVHPNNPIDFKHLYLVYASDGDITNTSNLRVIRGGFEYQGIESNNLVIEVNPLLEESQDSYNLSAEETYLTRGTIELNIGGRDADDLWLKLINSAKELSSLNSELESTYLSGGYVSNTGLSYEAVDGIDSLGFTNNSNATIRSILAANDIALENNMPSNMSTLEGAPGHDTILGSANDDILLVGYGNINIVEHINGDTGNDTANFHQIFTELNINLNTHVFTGIGINGEIINIENITGTNYSDTIIGDIENNILKGESGGDILNGGGGIDTIYGGLGADTVIFNVSQNSFFAPSDELVYGGVDSSEDTLQIELTTAELSNALKDEILDLYYNWTVVNTGAEKEYDFDILKLHAYEFEKLKVIVDGTVKNLDTIARDDSLMLQENGSFTGNLFNNNGYGADYTFGSSLTATAGTYTSIYGSTLVISNDGAISFVAAANYTGVEQFSYTVTDSAGYTKTATAYFNVQKVFTGNDDAVVTTGYDEVLDFRIPVPPATTVLYPVYVNSGAGNDLVYGTQYSDYINGGTGNDNLNGGDGNDVIYGEDGDDDIHGGNGNNVIYAGNGNDNVGTGIGSSLIYLGSGNDRFQGSGYFMGDDTVYGEDGDDNFSPGYGNDILDGGLGFDTISFYGNPLNGVSVDLTVGVVLNDGFGTSDTISSFERYNLSDFDDIFIDNGSVWTISTRDGNDEVYIDENNLNNVNIQLGQGINVAYGGKGNDVISSEGGNSIIYGRSGNDNINAYEGGNQLYGGDGDDRIGAGGSDNYLEGGSGNDTISINSNNGINTLYGNDGNDDINGGNSNDTIYGGNGNDDIRAYGGNDIISGDAGDDFIYSDMGIDTIDGGDGTDTFVALTYSGTGNNWNAATQNVIIDLSLSSGQVINDGFGNTENLINVENFWTTNFNDSVKLDASDNIVYAYGGNDIIDAGSGSDKVYAGLGDDTIIHNVSGTGYTDLYYGEQGNDTLKIHATSLTNAQLQQVLAMHAGTLTVALTLGIQIFDIEHVELYLNNTISSLSVSAKDDQFTTDNISTLSGNVLSNNGSGADYSISSTYQVIPGVFTTLMGGTVTISANGAFSYTADPGFVGEDSFQYTMTDGYTTSQATVSCHVTNPTIYTYGTSENDILSGSEADDIMYGYDGRDAIFGMDGRNEIYGGAGDDNLFGGSDVDIIYGGIGNDKINGGSGSGSLYGEDGDDIITSEGSDGTPVYIEGGDGADTITITGTGSSNVLGGNGDDTMIGGMGVDNFTGGNGADTFIFKADSAFSNIDTVTDYKLTDNDKLDISDLLIGYTPGVSDINDFAVLFDSGGDTMFMIDRDGAATDFYFTQVASLTNTTGLDAVDMLTNGQLIV